MFAPGLISAVFYRRRPTTLQIALGIAFTIVVSGLLGYIQDVGTSRVWENVALAIIGGVVIYVVILAYLVYFYFPKQEKISTPPQSPQIASEP
jgi:zinc transporter ZupT